MHLHFLKFALALMYVLNFESCALVRQRTKQERTDLEVSVTQREIKALSFCDSLATKLNIVFDSVEIIMDSNPSPSVKVKATKATISSATSHKVTESELAVSIDAIHTESSIEKRGERIVERSNKPPNWLWTIGIIVLTLLTFLIFKKHK